MDRDGLLGSCREGRANQSLNHGFPLVHTLALSNTTENHFFVQGLGRVCRLYVEVACHRVIGFCDFLFFIYIIVVVVVGGGGGDVSQWVGIWTSNMENILESFKVKNRIER